MKRLHLRLYLAIIGTLLAFLAAVGLVWHLAARPLTAVWGVEAAARMSADILEHPHTTQGANLDEQLLIAALARQLYADVALSEGGATAAPNTYRPPFEFTSEQRREPGWHFRRGPTFGLRLADGRMLLVHPRQRFIIHGLHVALILSAVAAVLALLTYPIARGITARLARLKQGVQKFGDGDLSARVAVEGRDEVAALAISFNESAAQVEQLMRANQQLLANCSHELRTPLTRMRLAIEQRADGDPRANVELARNIAELDQLIGELLLSSRLDAAKRPERIEPVDLLALVAEEAAYFDREVSASSSQPVSIEGDRLLLRRLVRNLIENARVHAGGASEIRVGRIDGQVQIVVEDSGPGVAPEDRDKIFEPFHRRQGGQMQSNGTGLGLSIARQIARLHGGEVAYAARAGGGSRFIVTFPG